MTVRWKAVSGGLLPELLVEKLELPSKKQARKIIDKGRCWVNGSVQRVANIQIHSGDLIEVLQDKEEDPIEIVYEDDWIYILNKPSGLVVDVPSIKKQIEGPFFLVHRLDKHTTGLLLIAKDSKTQRTLEKQFRDRSVKKAYLALVDGRLMPRKGEICEPIEKSGMLSHVSHKQGKAASTFFDVIDSTDRASLVFLRPQTGRTHQLRVHLSHVGHPILGDGSYSERFRCPLRPNRYLLHAWKICFFHPFTNLPFLWTASMPPDMADGIKSLFGLDVRKKLCAFSL